MISDSIVHRYRYHVPQGAFIPDNLENCAKVSSSRSLHSIEVGYPDGSTARHVYPLYHMRLWASTPLEARYVYQSMIYSLSSGVGSRFLLPIFGLSPRVIELLTAPPRNKFYVVCRVAVDLDTLARNRFVSSDVIFNLNAAFAQKIFYKEDSWT